MKNTIVLIIALITAASLCDTVSQLILKTTINSFETKLGGLKKIIQFILRIIFTPRVWVGFLFSCLSLFIWLFVLSKADLNFAFSVDSMHYFFIVFACQIFLKEEIGLTRWLGTVFITAGIVLVAIS